MSESLRSLLRDLRETNGKSLRATARELDVDAGYLSRIERGEKPASAAIQERLASYYEVEPELISVATGEVPEDVVYILREHPEVINELRVRFGTPR